MATDGSPPAGDGLQRTDARQSMALLALEAAYDQTLGGPIDKMRILAAKHPDICEYIGSTIMGDALPNGADAEAALVVRTATVTYLYMLHQLEAESTVNPQMRVNSEQYESGQPPLTTRERLDSEEMLFPDDSDKEEDSNTIYEALTNIAKQDFDLARFIYTQMDVPRLQLEDIARIGKTAVAVYQVMRATPWNFLKK